MRSLIFHGADRPLVIEHVPDPEPAPDEVVIRVGRCGICGSDLKMTDPREDVHFAPDSRLGHEYAGEIVALGRDVTGLAVGDRVTAMPTTGCGQCDACRAGDPSSCPAFRYLMGGFSEYTVASARYVARLPAGLSIEDGALVEPLACGSQAVRLSGAGRGSRALVLGAGPIGLTAVYWLRRAGCEAIAVAALSERNRSLTETMGATAFLRQGEDLPSRAADVLGGAPDVVIECVGVSGLLAQAVSCAGMRGTVISSGLCFRPEPFSFGEALMKQVRLQFSLAYVMDDFHRGIAALDAGHVEPRAMLGETVPLDAVAPTIAALRRERTGRKILVDPWK